MTAPISIEQLKKANASCPDCGVEPNMQHEDGCDIERCVLCGQQALAHRFAFEIDGDGGVGVSEAEEPEICTNTDEPIPAERGLWTGVWPGIEECHEFGWFARWTVVTKYSHDGLPDSGDSVSCEPDHPHAHEDLNRLGMAGLTGELRWDRERQRWVKP